MDDADFLADTIDVLERTPRVIRDLLWGLPDSWAAETDTPGGWRPRDVVGHLITGELTDWMPRAERIIHDGTSRPFDRFDRLEQWERDTDVPLNDLVYRFVELRAANLARLRELVSGADLDRRGLHPSLGEVTLRELLATWAVHDLDHLGQAFAAMAGSRDSAVGPWKQYLGVLLRRQDPTAVAG